jgi:hypothetical protein
MNLGSKHDLNGWHTCAIFLACSRLLVNLYLSESMLPRLLMFEIWHDKMNLALFYLRNLS